MLPTNRIRAERIVRATDNDGAYYGIGNEIHQTVYIGFSNIGEEGIVSADIAPRALNVTRSTETPVFYCADAMHYGGQSALRHEVELGK
jgi:hypothetical protein